MLSIGSILRGLNTYRIEKEIGRGGTSIVYRVLDLNSGQPFAAKVLSFHRFPQDALVERFRREVMIQKRLRHSNVLPVREIIGDTESCILISDYAPGGSLYEQLSIARKTCRRLPVAQALRWIWFIARGLEHIHLNGIVHRDLTPRNVLFRERDFPAVSDFGIARHLDDPTITKDFDRLGSLIYISPQQRDDPHAADQMDDVFSLGQVFYEIATGIVPHGNPPAIIQMRQDFPQELASFIELMRNFQKDARPDSAREVVKEITEAIFCESRDLALSDELPLSLVLSAVEKPATRSASITTLLSKGLISRSVKPNFVDTSEENVVSLRNAFSELEDSFAVLGLDEPESKKKVRESIMQVRRGYLSLSTSELQRFIVSRVKQFSAKQGNRKRSLVGECQVALFRGGNWENWIGSIKDLQRSGVGVLSPINNHATNASFIPVEIPKLRHNLIGLEHAWLVDDNEVAPLVKFYWGNRVIIGESCKPIKPLYVGLDGFVESMRASMGKFLTICATGKPTTHWRPLDETSIVPLLREVDELLKEYLYNENLEAVFGE